MTPDSRSKARYLIMKHEGFRANMYTDSTGHLTIGFGHSLSTGAITQHAGSVILDDDMIWHESHLPTVLPFYNMLSDARKAVLIDMSFNLGLQGLLGFTEMLQALEKGDYDAAADAMLNSKWAQEVKDRAIEDAHIMRMDSL